MIATRQPLHNKRQTAKRMYNIVRATSADLNKKSIMGKPLSAMPLMDYFSFVKNIPYRRDPKPREIVARPAHCIKFRNAGMDCKKKAILIAAWAKQHGIPYRFMASSRRADRRVHHVFPQLQLSGRFVNVDATYPTNRINEMKNYSRILHLKGD